MNQTLPQTVTLLSQAQRSSLINIVRRAAKAEIMPRFRNLSAGQISTKSAPDDLVTEADTAAEQMIARGILALFPNAMILGEEAASAHPELRDDAAKAELAFIIDPVDGTWNFAHGLATFGVILSATRFGVPIFGLLYDPVMDDWITTDGETDTVLRRPDGGVRSLSTSAGGALSELTGFIHFYLMGKDHQAAMGAAMPDFNRTFMLRCSCHEYRLLAQGSADFCLSGILNPWDHAAGVITCERAGGYVRLLDGRPYDISIRQGYLLAAANDQVWHTVAEHLSFLNEGD